MSYRINTGPDILLPPGALIYRGEYSYLADVTPDPATDLINFLSAHGLIVGDALLFEAPGTLPGGIVIDPGSGSAVKMSLPYRVISDGFLANKFKVIDDGSYVPGYSGPATDITSPGSPRVGVWILVFEKLIDVSAATPATDQISTTTFHHLQAGDRIRFTTTVTLPAPLVAGNDYIVSATNLSYTTFSIVSGGGILDITTAGTGTHSIWSKDIPNQHAHQLDEFAGRDTGEWQEFPSDISGGTIVKTEEVWGIVGE